MPWQDYGEGHVGESAGVDDMAPGAKVEGEPLPLTGQITLVVKTLISPDMYVQVPSDHTIRGLKAAISSVASGKLQPKRQELKFKDKILTDKNEQGSPNKLSTYNIQDNDVIWLKMMVAQPKKQQQERRQAHNRRWKLEDIMRLLHGIEIYGTYQYALVRRDMFPPDTQWTAQDLYDKWRNLVKAADATRAQRQDQDGYSSRAFRGVVLPEEILARVLSANRVKRTDDNGNELPQEPNVEVDGPEPEME